LIGPLIRDVAAAADALQENQRAAVREFLTFVARSIQAQRSAPSDTD